MEPEAQSVHGIYIKCSRSAINTNEGFEYTLTVTDKPGKLKQLEVGEYCLGDADGNENNNGDVVDWDHGYVK